MIILTWLLYFGALYGVYYLRVFLAGMGIFPDMIPTAIIHGLVFAGIYSIVRLGKKLLSRKVSLPAVPKKNILTYGVVTVGFSTMYAMNQYGFLSRSLSGYLINICVYIVLAVSLNLVVGISGELSLGHAGFMAVGAFTGVIASICMADVVTNELSRLVLALFVGGCFAGVAGFLVGVPVLRLRGDYLAIVTLAFGEILKKILEALYIGRDSKGLHFGLTAEEVHMASDGKMILQGPMGITTGSYVPIATFFAGFLLIVFTLIVVLNLIHSKEGRAIKAVRDNRIAAESVGINVTSFRLKAFVVSAFLAGMAGALYGLSLPTLQANKFGYNESINILVYVVLGGMGNILGSIISATVLYLIPQFLRAVGDYRMIIYAVVLVVVMLCTWSPKVSGMVQVVKSAIKDFVNGLIGKLKLTKKQKPEAPAEGEEA